MGTKLQAALIALLLSIGLGIFVGDATVSAMQVRRAPEAAPPPVVHLSQFDLGRLWAATHHPADADACPQTSLLFQFGCVAATRN